MDVRRFTKLKSDAETLQREVGRAEGALAQAMSRIKEEFGCSTVKEAEKKLVELEREREESEQKYDEAMADFEQKWSKVLKEVG